ADLLKENLTNEEETFSANDRLRVHGQNRWGIHQILARLTEFVEVGSGLASRFTEYANHGKTKYEVEHIWSDHFDRHEDEFDQESDFAEYRDRVGDLLLLPKQF